MKLGYLIYEIPWDDEFFQIKIWKCQFSLTFLIAFHSLEITKMAIFVTVWNTYLSENRCFCSAYIFSGHVSFISCIVSIDHHNHCNHRCNYHHHHCHHCQQFLSAQDNCCPCAIWSKNCGKYIQLNTPPSIHNSDEDEEVDFIPVLFWGLWLPCLS